MTMDRITAGTDVQGAAVIVDSGGEVSRVVVNNIHQFQTAHFGHLTRLMEASTRLKFNQFLQDISVTGAAFNWEMIFELEGQFCTFLVTGIQHQDDYLIILAENKQDTWYLLEEMLELTSQQVDFLRASVTDIQPRMDQDQGNPVSYFDEISSLNNELVNLQRIVTKQKSDLEQLNAHKDYFLGMAAHDLRNPLWAIKYFSEFLQSDLDDVLSDQQAEYLEIISSSSCFMLDLVEDLLDVTTISSGKLRLDLVEVDLGRLLFQVIKLNQALANQKSIKIRYHQKVDPGLKILLDPDRFQQVINNLLSNAVKFSPRGEQIVVVYTMDTERVCIRVEDNGPGIPADEQEKLFQLYGRTSVVSPEGEKSSGLGLAIARKIITAHQGDLQVESVLGEGTKFSVILPIQNRDEVN